MESMKQRLTDAVAGQLAAAPASTAKSELIEELSGNLYRHYLDLTDAGVHPELAFAQAMDCLGDTGELVDYLNSLQPGESLPELVPRPGQGDSGQLDELLKNVEDIVKGVLGKAKSALRDAKDLAEDSLGVSTDELAKGTREKVDQAIQKAKDVVERTATAWSGSDRRPPTAGPVPTLEEEGANQESHPTGPEPGAGGGHRAGGFPPWQFTAGYSRERGGFFAQWEAPDQTAGASPVPLDTPFSGQGLDRLEVQVAGNVTIRMTQPKGGAVVIGGDVDRLEAFRTPDGVLAIRQERRTASSFFFFRRGLACADVTLDLPGRHWKCIRVSTTSGDVELSGEASLDLLSVKTASGDLDVCLPQCQRLSFQSASGDLTWEGCVGELRAETVSGDLDVHGRLSRVGRLMCKSISGDIDWEGSARDAHVQTVSGDIRMCGQLEQIQLASVSGEIEVAGTVSHTARCTSTSGSICLESAQLPLQMELSSKSGDCGARIPDNGPFTVRCRTASGRFQSQFFSGGLGGRQGTFTHRPDRAASGQPIPVYQISSISGDLYLNRY